MTPKLFAALIAATLSLTPAQTSPAKATASASNEPAEVVAHRLIEAFNGPGSLFGFVETNFSAAALRREDAETRTAPLDRLKQASGGIKLLALEATNPGMLEILAVTAEGSKFAKFVLFTDANEPARISNLFVLSARDPDREKADAFSPGKLDDDAIVSQVQRRIDALGKEDRFSGAVLLAKGDRVLLREARGQADQARFLPNETTTRFNVASIGKMWTAVVLLRLVEEGKVKLDDTLAQWVPTYPHRQAAARITLRMLLQHRAGIGAWDGRRLGSLTGAQAAATMTAPPAEPDRRFQYSNAGYVLLAAVAEAASGMDYSELVQQHIFALAGMTRSGLWPVANVPDRATGYLRSEEDPLGFEQRQSNDDYLGTVADGSGGGYSTVDDLFAFHRALSAGKLVQPATLRLMTEMSTNFPGAPRPSRYGLGLTLDACSGEPTLGHGGGGPNSGVSAVTRSSVNGQWTIIVLSNYDPPAADELGADICALVHRQ